MNLCIRCAAMLVLLLCLPGAPASAQAAKGDYTIRQGIDIVRPEEGVRDTTRFAGRRAILQFYSIPDDEIKAELASIGITIENYVGGNAYIARFGKTVPAILTTRGIRAITGLTPGMKRSVLLRDDGPLAEAMATDRILSFDARFQTDVDFADVARLLAELGITTAQKNFHYNNTLTVRGTWRAVSRLLQCDELAWLDTELPPPVTMNADSSVVMNVKDVYNKKNYLKSSGSNVNVGVWDGGAADEHTDLAGRVTVRESDEGYSSHATHVSGTIAGNGALDGGARGMAQKANIYSWDFGDDYLGEIRAGLSSNNLDLSNHSWGSGVGWYYYSEGGFWIYYDSYQFGVYHDRAYSIDQLVMTYDFPLLMSAGNERDDGYIGPYMLYSQWGTYQQDLRPSNPDWGCITPQSLAKNAIAVGAVMKDKIITDFSSFGPTATGRLKPDIVAPGFSLFSTDLNNTYSYKSGTSMSCPAATGASALLMDYYKRLGGKKMGSAMLKALLIHTAEDLGNPGPDFTFGYGLVDAEFGARVLRAAANADSLAGAVEPAKKKVKDDLQAKVITSTITNKEKQTYTFDVPENAAELRISLVWNDPPGSDLINNLDLYAKRKGQKKVKPFTLDPSNPSADAKRKRNTRDNIEHCLAEKPAAGEWKIYVRGAKVPIGPQPYVLIISTGTGNNPSPAKTEGEMTFDSIRIMGSDDGDTYDDQSTFAHGDHLRFAALGTISENADYGNYRGTLSFSYKVYNSNNEMILKYYDCWYDEGPDYGPNTPWTHQSREYIIPNLMPAGTYRVDVTVSMHTGWSHSMSGTFTVE